jgi:hypothetical protein
MVSPAETPAEQEAKAGVAYIIDPIGMFVLLWG